MRIEAMHDKNSEFRLIGYRVVSENKDEERVLNRSSWSVQREHGAETAIHLILTSTALYPVRRAKRN